MPLCHTPDAVITMSALEAGGSLGRYGL